MTKAIGYTRLSRDGDSIPRQKEKIRKYCGEKGYELVAIYNEGERKTGYSDDRSEYQTLREDVASDEVDAVIVRDGARLGRDQDERTHFAMMLKNHNVSLHKTERGAVNLDDPVEFAVEVMEAGFDEEAKQKEIERAKEALAHRQENGYYQGGEPFGLEFDDAGEYLVASETFETARDVIRRRDRGETYAEVNDATEVAEGTIASIMKRRSWYEAVADGCVIGREGPISEV